VAEIAKWSTLAGFTDSVKAMCWLQLVCWLVAIEVPV
jgi:hypothetical protein